MTPADQIYSVPTNIGAAKLAYAIANRLTVKISEMALGDGNGVTVKPDATWTGLKRQVHRAQLNSLAPAPNNPNWLIAELAIPAEVGGWTIRELGLYDEDGDLIFVGNHPEQYKPVQSQGSDEIKVVRMVILVSSLAAVTLKTDPTTIMATLFAVDNKIAAHEAKADPHSKYLLRSAVAAAAGPLAWLGNAAGTANALTFSLVSEEAKVTAYAAGQRYQFKATAANTGAVTAKIGNLPAVAIKKASDAGLVDLDAGDIKPGALYDLNHDGAVFQLGGGVGGGKAFERYSFTASVGQAEFSFPHTVGATIVLRNGREVRDFASDGVKVVLANPCEIDDAVECLAFNSFKVADTYTKAEIGALWQTASSLPVGTMLPFPRDVTPPGFLEVENDSLYSEAAYPDLAAFLGGAFNRGGEPVGYFRLPESRGEFMRGWDHGRGVDAGREIGSHQGDAIRNITGAGAKIIGSAPGGAFGADAATNVPSGSAAGSLLNFDASRVVPTASENRPRNLAVKWCIKAWNAPVNQGQIDVAALAYLAAQATEASNGTAKVATDAQMLDSANDQVIATPKKLRKGFAISLAANGYIAFPSWLGGLVLQWGTSGPVTYDGRLTVSYPIEFPTACLAALANFKSGAAQADHCQSYGVANIGKASFQIENQWVYSASANNFAGIWIAVGH